MGMPDWSGFSELLSIHREGNHHDGFVSYWPSAFIEIIWMTIIIYLVYHSCPPGILNPLEE